MKETAGFTNIKFSDLEVVASGYLCNNTNKNVYFKETTLTEYIAVNGRLPLEYIKWFIIELNNTTLMHNDIKLFNLVVRYPRIKIIDWRHHSDINLMSYNGYYKNNDTNYADVSAFLAMLCRIFGNYDSIEHKGNILSLIHI